MAKLSLGQKADRVLKLLLGLRNPRSVALLASRGFREADLDEGWQLLRNLAKVRFDALPPEKADPGLTSKLDEWENAWFPVAEATLRRHFPKIHGRVFLNLSQTEGPAVVVSVGTFVDRIFALSEGDDQSKRAAKLLAGRGLGESALAHARGLLGELGKPGPDAPPPDLEAQREQTLVAENELWSWYLEWSQIARGVITDRQLLRELGFLRSGRVAPEEDEEESGVATGGVATALSAS